MISGYETPGPRFFKDFARQPAGERLILIGY
jgi:hypothetical protein